MKLFFHSHLLINNWLKQQNNITHYIGFTGSMFARCISSGMIFETQGAQMDKMYNILFSKRNGEKGKEFSIIKQHTQHFGYSANGVYKTYM